MHQPSSPYTWQTLRLMIIAVACLSGCSGSGPPGSGMGSTTAMQRQMEAATAARMKEARAAKAAAKTPAAATHPSQPSVIHPEARVPANAEPAVESKAKDRVTLAVSPSKASPAKKTSSKKKSLHLVEPSRRVSLSPDGSLAAIDAEDGSVRLVDARSGSPLAGWPGEQEKRSALALDPVHHLVAAASADGRIALLRHGNKRQEGLDSFARLHEDDFDLPLRGHRGRVTALGFDRSSEYVISAGEDGTLRVWRISSAAPLAVAVGESACAPAFDLDGKRIAVATAGHAVEMTELGDARRLRRLQHHKGTLTAMAFGRAKDFQVLASADEKGRIHVWDFQTDRDHEFVGHVGAVTALAVDETRRRIVSTASDGSLRIAPYPASQSQLLATLSGPPASLALVADQRYAALNVGPGNVSLIPLAGDADPKSAAIHGDNLTAYAIARDGEVMLAGTVTGSVIGQSRRDGSTVAEFTGAQGAVHALVVHPDGKRFAYSGDDGVIRIGRLPDAKVALPDDEREAAIEAHSGPVRSLAFTADGQTLISAGADNVVRLWNLAERSEVHSFPTLGIEPTIVCGTRNGAAVVVACGKKTVLVWNRDARKPASKLPLRGEVRSLALAPTGMLAIGMVEGDIQLWDIDRVLEIERLAGHTGTVDYLVFAGDTRLVSAGADKTVRLWSLSPARIIQAHRGAVRGMAVSQDNGRIVTGGDDRRLCLWSPDGELLRDDDVHLRITGLALHPRRPQVAFLTDDSFKGREVIRRNFDAAASPEPLRTPSTVKAVAYSSDGRKLAVAGTDDTVRVYDSQADTLLEEIPCVTSCTSVRFGPSDQLMVAETDNVVRTYRLRLHRCFQLASPVTCAAISTDGESLLSGTQDGEVRLWSPHSDLLRRQMQAHANAVTAVSFSGDGTKAFSADLGGMVRVWSLEDSRPSGQPLSPDEVLEHPTAVRALEPSTTGAMLVSGCDDGVTRVWNVTGTETEGPKVIQSYTGQASSVVGVRLMDIERSLLACTGDGILNLWKRPTAVEVSKGISSLTVAATKSTDLTALSPPPANDRVVAQDPSQVAVMENFLRTARIPAEREVWRKRIQAATDAPPKSADRPFVPAKLVPHGQAPSAEIGKGEPWDLPPAAEFKSRFPFDGRTYLPIEIAVSSDGKLLAAVTKSDAPGGRATLGVWDVPTGVELRRWESIAAGRWQALNFAGSDDAFVYTSPDVTTFELSTGKPRHFADDCLTVPVADRDDLLFGRSTNALATAPLLMRIDGGRFHQEWSGLKGYETLVTALACSADGRWAAVAVRERLRHKLILFDLQEMQIASVLDEAPHAKPWSTEGPIGIRDVVFSPDGKRLFWHGDYGPDDFHATTAVATPNGFNVPEKVVAKLKRAVVSNQVTDHVIGYVTGEADTLYLGTKTGLVLCESKSGKVTDEINLTEIHAIKVDGGKKKESEIIGLDVEGGEDRTGRVRYVVSADGAWMASADDGGKVVLWDLTTPRRPCNTFTAHTGPVVGLRFSRDNRWLATAGEENRIRLWNLTELQERRRRPVRKAAARP